MASAFTDSVTCCNQSSYRGLPLSQVTMKNGCCSDPKRFGSIQRCDRNGDRIEAGTFLHYAQENFSSPRYTAPMSSCNTVLNSGNGKVCTTPSASFRPLTQECAPAETRGGSCQAGSTMLQIVETENALRFDPVFSVTPGIDFLQQYM